MTTRTSSLGNDPPESQVTVQQALRTLRGIRHRCEMEQTAHPDWHSFNVQVALSASDMMWIDAAIRALEKPIVAGALEAAAPAAQV